MKTLVTGATGFLGSVLVRQLLEEGADVRILRRSTSQLDMLGRATNSIEHVVGDITDTACLSQAMQGVDRVYHVAASVHLGGRRVLRYLRHVNVYGTACVVNAALASGVERLVHTSSIAALGRNSGDVITMDETASWQDSPLHTSYAISKREAELEIHRGIAEGLDAVLVNPSVIFGPGRRTENTSLFVDRIRRGTLFAVPVGRNSVVDVEDVAAGHIRAMRQGETGERYILGSENLLWSEITNTLADAIGVTPPRRRLTPGVALGLATMVEMWAFVTRSRPQISRALARNAAQTAYYSNRKAVTELGCTFRPFQETAKRIAEAL